QRPADSVNVRPAFRASERAQIAARSSQLAPDCGRSNNILRSALSPMLESHRIVPPPLRFAGAFFVLILLGWVAEAEAHGARLPFEKWGGFRTATVRCQRVLARAAAQCAGAAWSVRRACESAELAGQSCDHDATDATIEAIRIRALNSIDQYCTERQAID